MKRLLKPFCVAALVVAAALPALANIAPAQPGETGGVRTRKSVPARMQLRPDAEAKEAKLIIPRAVLRQLRADLDGGDDSNAAAGMTAPRGLNLTATQTALAGVCLSLSLVFGGVWFLNSRGTGRRTARAAVSLAVVALAGAAAGAAVYANAGPPAHARKLTSRVLAPDTTYYGGPYGAVKVEITEENGDYIELRLPHWKDGKDGKEGE